MITTTDIIALGVRLVADNTTLIRKPAAFEALLTDLFEEETYDRRIARNIEAEAARAFTTLKSLKSKLDEKKTPKN